MRFLPKSLFVPYRASLGKRGIIYAYLVVGIERHKYSHFSGSEFSIHLEPSNSKQKFNVNINVDISMRFCLFAAFFEISLFVLLKGQKAFLRNVEKSLL